MPAAIRVKVTGANSVIRGLEQIQPTDNGSVREILLAAGFEVQRLAAQKYIVRGRGRKSPPLASRLTYRTGTLTRSLRVDRGRSFVEVGSDLVYARRHEEGRGVKARPFLKPALKEGSKRFSQIAVTVMERRGRFNRVTR